MKCNDIISYEDYVAKQRKQAYDLMYPGLPNWAKDTIFDINEYMNACELSSKGIAFGCANLKSKLQEIGSYFKISKPAVLDAIRTSTKKLEFYESKIKMLELKKSVENLIIKNDISKENLQKLLEKY